MTNHHQREHSGRIIGGLGNPVKARIVAAGINFGCLAAEAGMSAGNLSNYLAGRQTGYAGQQKIFNAFRKLSGNLVSFDNFWGALASQPRKKRTA